LFIVDFLLDAAKPVKNRSMHVNLGDSFASRQDFQRMGAFRKLPSQSRDKCNQHGSGGRSLPRSRPLRQSPRPLHDVILKIGLCDLVLTPSHPAAHGNTGFMNRVGITGNQGMPPIEIASLSHQPVCAARR
jgi:hypothetical protein